MEINPPVVSPFLSFPTNGYALEINFSWQWKIGYNRGWCHLCSYGVIHITAHIFSLFQTHLEMLENVEVNEENNVSSCFTLM
jgi:hypothetical protein